MNRQGKARDMGRDDVSEPASVSAGIAAEDACKAEHILSEQTLEKIRERALETDAETGSAQ